MKAKILTRIVNFLESEDGPTAVEYGIMLALIVAVCLAAIQSVGFQAQGLFEYNAEQMTEFMSN